MCLHMGYPQPRDELEILRSAQTAYDEIGLKPVATSQEIQRLQDIARQVFVEETVLEYVLKIVAATRTEVEFRAGVSVRGGLALKHAAQARALLRGRDFVVPEDVSELVAPVLVHRLGLVRSSADALEERRTVAAALKRIVASIPTPV
jgi:MoxR-like ATPase